MSEDLQNPQNSGSEPSTFPKRDFRQEVTNQIIEMLEKGGTVDVVGERAAILICYEQFAHLAHTAIGA